MPSLDTLNTDATAFLHWLLISSGSATIIAGVVLMVQMLFGRWLTPAGRQRLWLLVILRVVLPVLPASAMSIANVHIETLWTRSQPKIHFDADVDRQLISDMPISPTMHRVVDAPPARSWSEYLPIVVMITWAGVAMVLLSRLLRVNCRLATSQRNARVLQDAATLDLLRDCARTAKLRDPPEIVETESVATPAVFGIRRPRILMPAGLFESLTPMQRRHVVLHEMSHIRHHDLLANWVLALLSILHWFNPLLWLAITRMKADRELARDASVLRNSESNDAASYADTLIDLAQRLLTPGNHLAAPLPALFGRTTSLRRRLHMIARLSDSNRGSKLLSVGLLVLIGGGVLTGARRQTAATGAPATAALDKPHDAQQPTTKPADADPFDRSILESDFPTVQFNAVGFSSVIDFIRHATGAKIFVNWDEIEAAGIDRNAPVKADIHGVKFSRALDLILDNFSTQRTKLAYRVVDGVIAISTKRDTENNKNLVIRVYEIRDLLDMKNPRSQTDLFLKAIEDQVDPKSWRDHGGKVGLAWSLDIGQLVVKQTPENHRRIAALLQTLRDDHAKKD